MAEEVIVTVAFAPVATREDVTTLRLSRQATLRDAFLVSGLAGRHPAVDFASARWGVWGKAASPQDLVRAGDRVEIYRPLVVDPKVARARRAFSKKAKVG